MAIKCKCWWFLFFVLPSDPKSLNFKRTPVYNVSKCARCTASAWWENADIPGSMIFSIVFFFYRSFISFNSHFFQNWACDPIKDIFRLWLKTEFDCEQYESFKVFIYWSSISEVLYVSCHWEKSCVFSTLIFTILSPWNSSTFHYYFRFEPIFNLLKYWI